MTLRFKTLAVVFCLCLAIWAVLIGGTISLLTGTDDVDREATASIK